MKQRLEKLTTNSSLWYYLNPMIENTHLTPNMYPKTPHSQLIHHFRRSTELTVIIFESFHDSQNTINRMTKLFSSSQIPACDWWQINWFLMSSCVSHDVLLKHFIRRMDIWERLPSSKKSTLVHVRLFFWNVGVRTLYKTKQNNEAKRKVHELQVHTCVHTRGIERAKPMQKHGAMMAPF